ncbi:MAG: thiolase, partial [Hyphomicrobiales bacterium]
MTRHLSKKFAIVGAAESDLGKVPGMTSLDLQAQAAGRALRDAGLTLTDIDGVFAHVDDKFASIQLAEYLGIRPRYVDSTSVGGMSSVMHIRHAMAAIEAGMCEVALVAYGSTQLSDGTRKVGGVPEDMRMPRGQFITPYGQLSPIGYYAMVAHLHMERYGTTHKDLAEVAVAARKWAQLNPKAYRRDETSIEEVMASKMIADPLRQRDCCLVTDAGGAFILTTAARARSLKRPPVYVMG